MPDQYSDSDGQFSIKSLSGAIKDRVQTVSDNNSVGLNSSQSKMFKDSSEYFSQQNPQRTTNRLLDQSYPEYSGFVKSKQSVKRSQYEWDSDVTSDSELGGQAPMSKFEKNCEKMLKPNPRSFI